MLLPFFYSNNVHANLTVMRILGLGGGLLLYLSLQQFEFTKEEKKAGKKVYSKSSFDTNKLGFEKGLRRQGAEIIIKGWNETVNGKNGNRR